MLSWVALTPLLFYRAIYSRILGIIFYCGLFVTSITLVQAAATRDGLNTKEVTSVVSSLSTSKDPSTSKELSTSKDELQNQLSQFQLKDGHGLFNQAKHFKLLSHPIISSGEYWLDTQVKHEMIWQVNKPIFNRLKITPNSIKQQTSATATETLLTQQQEFTRLLYAVFTGQLSQYKGLSWQETKQNCLNADVTDEQLAKFITQIQLCKIAEPTTQLLQTSIIFIDQSQTKTVINLIPDQMD